jgi:hypothetical protein
VRIGIVNNESGTATCDNRMIDQKVSAPALGTDIAVPL